MIKIDFDDVRKDGILNMDRIFEAQKCLNELKPCLARVSASRDGFHILKHCNDGLWAEGIWDDKKRRLINEIRHREGLTADILFNKKSYLRYNRGTKCFLHSSKEAGDWQLINDGYDVERFLDYWRI